LSNILRIQCQELKSNSNHVQKKHKSNVKQKQKSKKEQGGIKYSAVPD